MHLGHEKEGKAGKQRTLASELRFLAESIHCLYVWEIQSLIRYLLVLKSCFLLDLSKISQ